VQSGVASKVIAASFALAGFAIAVIAGLSAGNNATRVLTAALVSMAACHIIGLGVGAIGERTVNDYLATYRSGRPLPELSKQTGAPQESGARNVIRV